MAERKGDMSLIRLTLVAAYGEKPPELAAFITETQARLAGLLGAAFAPYTMSQVHATIVGLEGERESDAIINRNYRKLKGRVVTMDHARIPALLRRTLTTPLTIRMAGYRIENAYPFASRGAHPALRTFSIQGDHAVVMGWPADANDYPLRLDALRRAFNAVGVLHKYHTADDSIDNDCYFVLGRIDREALAGPLNTIEERMRDYLSAHAPVDITLDERQLGFAVYEDEALPESTTRYYPVAAAKELFRDLLAGR